MRRGRMRGQAFLTFTFEEKAEEVLLACNGYPLHGQPLVMVRGSHAAPPLPRLRCVPALTLALASPLKQYGRAAGATKPTAEDG